MKNVCLLFIYQLSCNTSSHLFHCLFNVTQQKTFYRLQYTSLFKQTFNYIQIVFSQVFHLRLSICVFINPTLMFDFKCVSLWRTFFFEL